jgi:DNA-binding transcriptional ArsR family regulator
MVVKNISVVFNKAKLEKAAYILKAVAHPVRLAIIQLLENEESLSVNQICEAVICEQSLISHHLINMKLRGILKSNKEGLNMYYSLKERDVSNIIKCIENCDCNM